MPSDTLLDEPMHIDNGTDLIDEPEPPSNTAGDGAGEVNGSIWLPGVDIEDDDYILGCDWISEPAHWESRGICPSCGNNYDYIWLYFVECDDDPFMNETTAPHLSPGEEQALIMYRHIDDAFCWRLLHPGPLQDWRWPPESRHYPLAGPYMQ